MLNGFLLKFYIELSTGKGINPEITEYSQLHRIFIGPQGEASGNSFNLCWSCPVYWGWYNAFQDQSDIIDHLSQNKEKVVNTFSNWMNTTAGITSLHMWVNSQLSLQETPPVTKDNITLERSSLTRDSTSWN